MDIKPKTYADCLLYKKYPQYNAQLLDAIMRADRINKEEKSFEDVIYEIKRTKTDSSILKVLMSKNTVLIEPGLKLPKPFKVFVAKDAKDGKQVKAFIDVTDVIRRDADGYTISDDTLLSYLINAKTAMYYALKPQVIVNVGDIRTMGATCFSALFTHIVDYVGKISIIEYAKDKCIYLASRYFLSNILSLDNEDQIRAIARKISGISEMKENNYDFMIMKETTKDNDPFHCPKAFTALIAKEFKIEDLTLDVIVEKWLYLYGQGTGFALEFFPAFSAMMTDAYTGAYINNQKTIQKVCGMSMVEYSKRIIHNFG